MSRNIVELLCQTQLHLNHAVYTYINNDNKPLDNENVSEFKYVISSKSNKYVILPANYYFVLSCVDKNI